VTDERLYVLAIVVDPRYLRRPFGAPTLASAKQWLLEQCTAAAAEEDVEAAEEQMGPPANHQRVDNADTEPSSSSMLEACLSQFLALAEPSASVQPIRLHDPGGLQQV